jgi:hypothetical protein
MIEFIILFYNYGVLATAIMLAYQYVFLKNKREGIVKELDSNNFERETNDYKNLLLIISLFICCLGSWGFIIWKFNSKE